MLTDELIAESLKGQPAGFDEGAFDAIEEEPETAEDGHRRRTGAGRHGDA